MANGQLKRLAEELVALAEQVRRDIAEPVGSHPSTVTRCRSDKREQSSRAVLLTRWQAMAVRLYRFRRCRDRLLGALFGEPAWDVLLDLFITEATGKQVSVGGACIASGVSHATALRHIGELVKAGLVVRERDARDKRRTYVKLSDEGVDKMALMLEQLAGSSTYAKGDGFPDISGMTHAHH